MFFLWSHKLTSYWKHCQSALIKDNQYFQNDRKIDLMSKTLPFHLPHMYVYILVVTIPSKHISHTHNITGFLVRFFFVNKQIKMVFKLQHAWRLFCCVWNVHCFQQNLDLLKSLIFFLPEWIFLLKKTIIKGYGDTFISVLQVQLLFSNASTQSQLS